MAANCDVSPCGLKVERNGDYDAILNHGQHIQIWLDMSWSEQSIRSSLTIMMNIEEKTRCRCEGVCMNWLTM